jgi:hypothetical protein
MSKTKTLQAIDDITFLTNDELSQIKGGILLTCEEKRSRLTGTRYMVPVIKNDGSLWLSIRM